MIIYEKFQIRPEGYIEDFDREIPFATFYEGNTRIKIMLEENTTMEDLNSLVGQQLVFKYVLETRVLDNNKKYVFSEYNGFISEMDKIGQQNQLDL